MGALFFKTGKEKLQNVEKTFFDLEAKDIDGNLFKFSNLKSKKAIVVVNVAQHYKQLVDLYKTYQNQGLEILGFPCNQFMSQEPKPEPEIKQFVIKQFGATFPLFWKINVNGPDCHEVYRFLRLNTPYFQDKEGTKQIPWNFAKFLLNQEGKVVGFFPPDQNPVQMENQIKGLLGI